MRTRKKQIEIVCTGRPTALTTYGRKTTVDFFEAKQTEAPKIRKANHVFFLTHTSVLTFFFFFCETSAFASLTYFYIRHFAPVCRKENSIKHFLRRSKVSAQRRRDERREILFAASSAHPKVTSAPLAESLCHF